MGKLYLAKQKIFKESGDLFGYELLFRDSEYNSAEIANNMKATSQVILNTLTNLNMDELLGKRGTAFINVDEKMLLSGIIDMLDNKRFVLEMLETIELSENVIQKIKYYHRRGFMIAVDDFDCSTEMIKKFAPLIKHIHIFKIDVLAFQAENFKPVIEKLKSIGIRLLAEKIETREAYQKYKSLGFDLFQGYYLHKPEVVEADGYKEVAYLAILHLIKLIKNDEETVKIEMFIKQKADLSYKLIKFLNNQVAFTTPVESMTQVITLLGRDRLLRWLMVYLYSEISTNPASKTLLHFAIRRAEIMEEEAQYRDKEKAYLAGMFSLLGAVFNANVKELMQHVKMDRDITNLVVDKKGKFAQTLLKIEKAEKEYLKKLVVDNFDKFSTVDIIDLLEKTDIETESGY